MTKSEIRSRYVWGAVILGILMLWVGPWLGLAIFGVLVLCLLLSAYGQRLQSRNGESAGGKLLERAGYAIAMTILIALVVIAVFGGGHSGSWVVRP